MSTLQNIESRFVPSALSRSEDVYQTFLASDILGPLIGKTTLAAPGDLSRMYRGEARAEMTYALLALIVEYLLFAPLVLPKIFPDTFPDMGLGETAEIILASGGVLASVVALVAGLLSKSSDGYAVRNAGRTH
jgi:hypothetical protein